MAQNPSVNEMRSFTFTIISGNEPAMNLPVGRLYIQEVKSAMSRHGLLEVQPDYGFRLLDENDHVVAEVSPGYWPFFKKVVEEAAPLHSAACIDDCKSEIGPLTVLSGEAQ